MLVIDSPLLLFVYRQWSFVWFIYIYQLFFFSNILNLYFYLTYLSSLQLQTTFPAYYTWHFLIFFIERPLLLLNALSILIESTFLYILYTYPYNTYTHIYIYIFVNLYKSFTYVKLSVAVSPYVCIQVRCISHSFLSPVFHNSPFSPLFSSFLLFSYSYLPVLAAAPDIPLIYPPCCPHSVFIFPIIL